jgi:hypothetical protein
MYQTRQLHLENKFYVLKTATCFDLYIGQFESQTFPKARIEEDNV